MADRGKRRRRTRSARRESLLPTICKYVMVIIVALSVHTTEAQETYVLTPRNYTGIGNNVANPSWGAVGTTQIRSVAGADYEADGFTPPGALRPSARELMSEVFLASTPSTSTRSVLFIAWGQLLCFDMHLNVDNSSDHFDVPCNDGGGGLVDVWCPQGAASEDIPFFRSDAGFSTNSSSDSDSGSDSDSDSVRSPVNYATAYIDLDFVYGRSEGEAEALRTMERGLMNITETGVPFRNADGTWLIADQRTAQFPVTFALHIMFLLEHNRCCIDVAPQLDYEGDEDIYQACRAWTIALFQHVSENDYFIRLLGTSVASLDDNPGDYTPTNTTTTTTTSNSVSPSTPPSSSGGEEQSGTRRARALRKTEGGASGEDGRGGGDASASLLEASVGGGGGSVDRGSALNSPSAPLVNHPDDGNNAKGRRRRSRSKSRRLYVLADYEPDVNPAADVFALTMGAAAFESAIPSTVRVVSEGYIPTAYDRIELTVAREDMDTLFAQPGIVEDVLRGAVLSPALEINTCYSAALSNLSPLFKLPVDAVQRGRDHGLPTYNAARLAYDLAAASNFSDVTGDEELAALLSDAHGGDIDNLDAITGALAEGTYPPSGDVLEALLVAAWSEQLLRSLLGDRFHHLHSRPIEDVKNTTLAQVLDRAVNLTDLPMSVFDVPGVVVCAGNCEAVGTRNVTLSDSFKLAWEESEDDILEITLQAKGIGSAGMLGIGFGGLTMATAQDFIICEVTSEVTGTCIDRQPTTSRSTPDADTEKSELNVTMVDVEGEWTTIKFQRDLETLDPDQDYDLSEDIETAGAQTLVIYSYRRGEGVGQHPNANRGAATVNFLTGEVDEKCDDNDFVSLHGALMLIAWLLLAPWGIYYIRYRKGETVAWAGYEWYEIHQEIMILAAEAVLPLGITAVFASGGNHTTSHAHWGYYMIAAVFLQLFTGWMRTKGLEAKHANYSFLHRFNKHFHIWAGRFAYLAGVVQCYRGLELVASSDELIFSAGDGLDLQLGSFGWMKDIVFPIWLGFILLCFVCLESRKQYRRYFAKGAANVCGFMEVINEDHALTKDKVQDRLVPRTEDLPIYTMAEFNDKVLNGQSWALVDGAILDVSNFSQRHPGGARLILNAVGTDVTHELLGQDLSVGHAMSFSPHVHPRSAWEIVHSLVVGYVEEDEEEASQWERDEKARSVTIKTDGTRIRVAGKEVLLMGTMGARGSLTGDNLANKAKRLNDIATIPDVPPSPESSGQELPGTAVPSVVPAGRKELDHPVRRIARSPTGSKRLLEQFHVCPLLFREKMGVSSDIGRGDLPTTRPVYKYIFSCPGQAQALVRAVTGVCYFNMRAFDPKKGLIQRSYNAFAVRVVDTAPATPGGGIKGGGGTGAGTRTITPARQTEVGSLCIEMRIRLYRDGAMSQLLEELAKATDNPAVQLQGPFIIQKLVPPPAHRNVVMIAAGTGINPMVQQMRDYQALSNSRDKTVCAKSRLVLIWQCVNESELYGGDEITAMQAKSNGLMEVTLLISGDQRRRNIPGAAFMKAKEKMLMGARALLSPAFSSPNSSVHVGSSTTQKHQPSNFPRDAEETPTGSPFVAEQRSQQGGNDSVVISQHGPIDENETASHGLAAGRVPSFGGLSRHRPTLSNNLSEDRSRGRKKGARRRVFSKHLERDNSSTTSGLNRGKVNRDIIEGAFGDCLMTTLDEYNDELTSTTKRGGSGGGGGGGGSSGDKEGESEQKAGDTASDSSLCGIGDGGLEALVGDEETGGKLQVVVSGPSGFVFHVETLLAEMGVPPAAIVLLD